MKNFSIVGAGLAGALLAAGLAAAPAQAAQCAFKPDAPDQHKVVRGDTLWDISGQFLQHPWCWPQVWGMNKDEIHNPHWIYPGQIIYFDRKAGRLSLTPPGAEGSGGAGAAPVVRMSPQLRTEGLGKDAIRSISSALIEPFLTQPLIVEDGELAGAPRIVASQEARVNLGKDDKVYVRGELRNGTSFQVFRPGTPVRDPDSGKQLGYEAIYLGTVTLQARGRVPGEAHTFTVTSSKQEMGIGDLLMPAPPNPLQNYVPHPPERPVVARVVSIHNGVNYAGQNQVVSVNRGSADGLDIGAVLQLSRYGQTVQDPTGSRGILGFGSSKIKLPDEEYGTLFIFRVFRHIAYGLVMQVREPVQTGDLARSPE